MDKLLLNIESRCPNFSLEEVNRLKGLIDKYAQILFCKRTDAISTTQKDATWHHIAKEFNSQGQTHRTIKQLKNKFENIKRSARKEVSQHRSAVRGTGGGPPPPPISEEAEWMRSKMPLSMEGHEAQYDDDVVPSTSHMSPLFIDTGANVVIEDQLNELPAESQLGWSMKKVSCSSASSPMTPIQKTAPHSGVLHDETPVGQIKSISAPQKGDPACSSAILTTQGSFELTANMGAPAGLLRQPMSTPLKRIRRVSAKAHRQQVMDLTKEKRDLTSKKSACLTLLEQCQREEHTMKMQHLQEIHNQKLEQEKIKVKAEFYKAEQERIKMEILEKENNALNFNDNK